MATFAAMRIPILTLLACTIAYAGVAQSDLKGAFTHPGSIRYSLDMANVDQHELRVTVEFPAVGTDVFTVRMPQSSPGRYAEHNFAKNVYDLTATGADGQPLVVHQAGLGAWAIAGHGGAVTLSYTLFADGGDGTYAGVDDRKLHLNMPACFVYGEHLNDRPIVLSLSPSQRPDWTVASQLVPVAGDRVRVAPNYDYFYDSPTMVGDITLDSFRVSNPDGTSQRIELAMIHEGTRAEFDDYLAKVERVVLEQQKVYGELPRFDYGRYTFLCSYNPYIGGDGMEHRNSTVCSSTASLADAAQRLIGTVSHEFFHCWNVERIRPATLEPFDFSHANQSGELWFAEGFTSYYDDLTLVRAGIYTAAEYAEGLIGQLNYVLLSPGRRHRNPVQMSQQAPYVDAATSNDPNNFTNTFVSYYSYGATLGLALDLELRNRDHTLDEVMRRMWELYGKPEVPYHIRDIQLAVGAVTGDQAFAKTWFDRHIYASELPDLAELLSGYGMTLAPKRPDAVGFYRLGFRQNDGKLLVSGRLPENSPLYATGLDDGDEIISLAGKTITTEDDWGAAVRTLRSGQETEIRFHHLGRERVVKFTAAASPELTLTLDAKPSRQQVRLRKAWLGA